MKVLMAVQDPDDADSRFRSAEIDTALAVWECFETGCEIIARRTWKTGEGNPRSLSSKISDEVAGRDRIVDGDV